MKINPIKLDKPKRVYTYNRGLYFTYKMAYAHFQNEYFQNRWWESLSEWFAFIAIGRDFKLFYHSNQYFNGHSCRWVCILGLTVGYGFTWDSVALEDESE